MNFSLGIFMGIGIASISFLIIYILKMELESWIKDIVNSRLNQLKQEEQK